jgi:hypothetical protein
VSYAMRRHSPRDCFAFDSEGREMASLASDGSYLTDFGGTRYKSGDWQSDMEAVQRDSRFLVLHDFPDPTDVVIYEIVLSTNPTTES